MYAIRSYYGRFAEVAADPDVDALRLEAAGDPYQLLAAEAVLQLGRHDHRQAAALSYNFV